MFAFVRIAFRNMFRNPRRSGLVVAAIAVGLWGLIFTFGFSNGMNMQSIENSLNSHIGHLQIHSVKYAAAIEGFNFFRYQLDKTMDNPEEVENALKASEHIKAYSPRVLTNGLITYAQNAAGVAIVGISPEKEKYVTWISQFIVKGHYLDDETGDGIVLGTSLADKIGVEVGDKVVLMAQDINKDKAMSAFRVVGIYKSVINAHDKVTIYIGKETAQKMLGLGNSVHEYVIVVDDIMTDLSVAQKSISGRVDKNEYTVMTWYEIFPVLTKIVGFMEALTYIFFLMIFFAMAFGIANAVLMAVFERIHELGIMRALGVKPSQIFILIAFESACLGVTGVFVGALAGTLTNMYFAKYGINLGIFSTVLSQMGLGSVIYPRMNISILINGGSMALATALLSSIWPAAKAARLIPVDAIKHI